MKCPKCHRETYSKKWDSCTACDAPVSIEAARSVTKPATVTKAPVSQKSDIGGRPRKYATDADRQRAYRERKKADRAAVEVPGL